MDNAFYMFTLWVAGQVPRGRGWHEWHRAVEHALPTIPQDHRLRLGWCLNRYLEQVSGTDLKRYLKRWWNVGTRESTAQHCQRADMRGRLTEQHGTTTEAHETQHRHADAALGWCVGVWWGVVLQTFASFLGVWWRIVRGCGRTWEASDCFTWNQGWSVSELESEFWWASTPWYSAFEAKWWGTPLPAKWVYSYTAYWSYWVRTKKCSQTNQKHQKSGVQHSGPRCSVRLSWQDKLVLLAYPTSSCLVAMSMSAYWPRRSEPGLQSVFVLKRWVNSVYM